MTQQSDATKSGALERSTTPRTTVITTPDEYSRSLNTWNSERYHVLSPITNVGAIPAQFGLVPAMVRINPDPKGGEVYADKLFCKGDEVALAKNGLAKIAQAAGMSIKTERTDPRTIPHYWEVRATARWMGLDGTIQEIDNTVEYDLRDGAARIRSFTPGQVQAARAHGLRGCEARAINAVVRQYGVRQKYTAQELAKPFVVVRVVFNPDQSDPTMRQLVADRALAGTSALFPGARALTAAAPVDAQVIDVIGSEPDGAVASGPTRQQPVGRKVEDVRHDIEAGLYEVRLDGGEVVTTSDGELGKVAAAAKRTGQLVVVTADVDDTTRIGGLRLLEASKADGGY